MTVPARSITVVQGERGSGKSTLINLLLRFHATEKGRISIGGIDIGLIPRRELREKIGVLSQQHFIFHESLRDNLKIAKPDANEDEILHALERAHLGEIAVGLPMGIDTKMDPRDKGISAGEKQRICLARLMLRNSPIMILDEPWSKLGGRARRLLAEVLNSCKADATILILTHELLEDLNVDLFYYLDGTKGVFSMAGSAPARE